MLDFGQTHPLLSMLDGPSDRLAQYLTSDAATGLADGRQAYVSPFLRTILPQLRHQGPVRPEYERQRSYRGKHADVSNGSISR